MKFLLVVLAVHFLAEVTRNKRNNNRNNDDEKSAQEARHPAEFRIR